MGRLMSSLGTKRLTFDEWQALPETTQICEVVDGVLVMPPTPLWEHQWLSMEIAVRLRNFVNERGMGLAITAPYDILIQREPLRTRQPDILVVNAALTGVTSPADLVGQPFLELPPLLVVEVVSPGNTRREIDERLADYRSIGVPECWLVNFPAKSVEVLRLTAEAATTTAIFGMGDTLSCEVLPGFMLPIADIFGPLLP
jgi:Uma2 family endonuclease